MRGEGGGGGNNCYCLTEEKEQIFNLKNHHNSYCLTKEKEQKFNLKSHHSLACYCCLYNDIPTSKPISDTFSINRVTGSCSDTGLPLYFQ